LQALSTHVTRLTYCRQFRTQDMARHIITMYPLGPSLFLPRPSMMGHAAHDAAMVLLLRCSNSPGAAKSRFTEPRCPSIISSAFHLPRYLFEQGFHAGRLRSMPPRSRVPVGE
jgi:hypothetical protein